MRTRNNAKFLRDLCSGSSAKAARQAMLYVRGSAGATIEDAKGLVDRSFGLTSSASHSEERHSDRPHEREAANNHSSFGKANVSVR